MNSNEKLRMIADLMLILGVRSVTNSALGRIACQGKIENIARGMGFKTEKKAKGQVLVISPKGLKGIPKLGIVVHSDTVDTDEKKWRTDPYGEIIGDRLYGRGVIDDKMGIIVSLYAMKELDGKIDPSWQIIIGSREEDEWTDMRDYFVENNPAPEFSITVDGDGIQHGCRGTANVMFYFNEGKGFADIKNIRVIKPQWNVTPAEISVETDDFYDRICAKAMHSSIATSREENAIYKLAKKYKEALQRQFPGAYEFIEGSSKEKNAEGIFIPTIPETLKKEGFPESSISMTMLKTQFGRLGIGLNVRLGPGITKSDLDEALDKVDKTYGCTHEIFGCTLSSYISPKSKEIEMMLASYRKVLGKETQSTFALGTGYNATFPNCAIFGPRFAIDHDEEDFCHCVDENRRIEDIYRFEEMLEDFIGNYLKI